MLLGSPRGLGEIRNRGVGVTGFEERKDKQVYVRLVSRRQTKTEGRQSFNVRYSVCYANNIQNFLTIQRAKQTLFFSTCTEPFSLSLLPLLRLPLYQPRLSLYVQFAIYRHSFSMPFIIPDWRSARCVAKLVNIN
jgi:hypothetical protein